ncbi:DUF58 domain-containing protein [Chloroflexota bacterium]
MTKTGFVFIVVGIFIYFLASQTQIGWLYLFDAVIWSLLILSVILPWYNLRSLQIERQVLLPATALRESQLGGPLEDEEVEIRLKLTNNGHLPRYFIKIVEDCPFEEPGKRQKTFVVASLDPKSTLTFTYPANCYRRGYYASAGITLQSTGLLGLVVRRHTYQLPLKLTVYPVYFEMRGLPAADNGWAELGHMVRSKAAAEFYGSRDYQHGDPLKHIHWRNTARLGRFMLKEFEQTNQGRVIVVLETGYDFGTGRETTLEYSLKIAASLARLCTDTGRTMDIITGKTSLFNAGWQETMNYLARIEVNEKTTTAELGNVLEPGQVVVAIVPALKTKVIPALSPLSGRENRLIVVLLRGFAAGEKPPKFGSELKGRNLDVVSCYHGQLEVALKELGNSLFFASGLSAYAVR